jgi:hypothetical protein
MARVITSTPSSRAQYGVACVTAARRTTLTRAWAQIPETKTEIGAMWRVCVRHNEEARRFRDALLLDIRP